MTTLSEASIQEAFQSDDKFDKLTKEISKALTSKQYDILKLVECLGFALTSPAVDQRVNGTKFLSSILNELPKDYLDEKQLTFIVTFYSDRLKDQHNVMPHVINGIAALIKMQQMPPACVPQFLQSFFQHSSCQSQTQEDRFKLYNIFQYLIEHFPQVLKAMSGNFVYGLINSMDGERDPRNLEFIFTFMPSFLSEFPLLHLSEEMFEIFACYFPIDFNPSKSDPASITRERLAEKLANCLVGTVEFIDWAVELALEKLDSDLLVAKLDSLELLEAAALKHPPKSLESHFPQIWLSIKQQIFPGAADSTDIQTAGLKALRTILEQAASDPEVSHNFQTQVMATILTHLSDIQQRLFNPATSIALVCISGDAEFASAKVLNTFLLKLEDTTSSTLSEDQRMRLYNIIAQIYKIVTLRNKLSQMDVEITQRVHSIVIATLRSIENAEDASLNVELIRSALSVINESIPLLSEANRALVYKILVQLVTHTSLDLDLKSLLNELGALQPIELQAHFIDVCVRNFSIFSNDIKRKIYKNLLPLVPQLAFTERVLDLVQTNVWSPDTPSDVRLLALDAFNSLLKQQDAHFIVGLQQSQSLIDKLIKLAQKTSMNYDALEYIAATLSLIMQNLPIAEQYMIATEYLYNLNLQLAADLFIAKGLLGFLHKDISLDDHFERLLTDLTQLSLQNEHEELRTVAHHLLCSLVNKIEYSEANRSVLGKIIAKLKAAIKLGDEKAVQALSWLAKGLIMRGAEEAGEIVEALAELLDHPSLSTAAALAFDVISAEYPELHLPLVKYLYKQKFFHMVMAKMGAKLESFCEHHLNAFIYVLKATPHAILKVNIVKVLPILFKSLETNKVHTLCIGLEICENFVKAEDEHFRAKLDELIPICLKLTKFGDSMKVRIAALHLLEDFTKYPTFAVLKHRVDVIFALEPVLDDPKRLVRNAAVTARNSWFLLGQATGVFE